MNGGCFAGSWNKLNKYYPRTSVVGKYFETLEAEEKQTGQAGGRLQKLIPRTFIPEQIAGRMFTEKIPRSILFDCISDGSRVSLCYIIALRVSTYYPRSSAVAFQPLSFR